MPATPAAPASPLATEWEQSDPDRQAPPEPIAGFHATGERRPEGETLRFDLTDLPLGTWGPARAGAGFSLAPRPNGFTLVLRSMHFAELVVAESKPGTRDGLSAFTGGTFGDGGLLSCGSRGKRVARWTGFAPKGWTDGGVDVEMGEGTFDLATCNARASASLSARAKAVVPGYVYALRVRDDRDAPFDSLVVFLPRSTWLSSSGDPNAPIDTANTGAFTRLTFPLEPCTGGSASLRVPASSLTLWKKLRKTGKPVWNFQDEDKGDAAILGVDVTCQGEARFGVVSIEKPRFARVNNSSGWIEGAPYAELAAAAHAAK